MIHLLLYQHVTLESLVSVLALRGRRQFIASCQTASSPHILLQLIPHHHVFSHLTLLHGLDVDAIQVLALVLSLSMPFHFLPHLIEFILV